MSQMSDYFEDRGRESFFRRVMHTFTGSIVIVATSAASTFLFQWFGK